MSAGDSWSDAANSSLSSAEDSAPDSSPYLAPAFVESTQVHPRAAASSQPASRFSELQVASAQLRSPSGSDGPVPDTEQQQRPSQHSRQQQQWRFLTNQQQNHTQSEQSGDQPEARPTATTSTGAPAHAPAPAPEPEPVPVRVLFRHPDPTRARHNDVLVAVHRGSVTDTSLVHTTTTSLLRDLEPVRAPELTTRRPHARALPRAAPGGAGGKRREVSSAPDRPAAAAAAAESQLSEDSVVPQDPEISHVQSLARPQPAASSANGDLLAHSLLRESGSSGSPLARQQQGDRPRGHEEAHLRASHPGARRYSLVSACRGRSLALDPNSGPHTRPHGGQHGECSRKYITSTYSYTAQYCPSYWNSIS